MAAPAPTVNELRAELDVPRQGGREAERAGRVAVAAGEDNEPPVDLPLARTLSEPEREYDDMPADPRRARLLANFPQFRKGTAEHEQWLQRLRKVAHPLSFLAQVEQYIEKHPHCKRGAPYVPEHGGGVAGGSCAVTGGTGGASVPDAGAGGTGGASVPGAGAGGTGGASVSDAGAGGTGGAVAGGAVLVPDKQCSYGAECAFANAPIKLLPCPTEGCTAVTHHLCYVEHHYAPVHDDESLPTYVRGRDTGGNVTVPCKEHCPFCEQ